MNTPDTVYVTYIATTPEKVWAALTIGEITHKYFFGRRIECDWKTGSTINFWQEDGTLDVTGTILKAEENRLLEYTWHVEWIEELRALPSCIITFRIEQLGPVVRLTMIESHPEPIDEKYLEGGRRGWPAILSGLKSLLETGKPLPAFDPMK